MYRLKGVLVMHTARGYELRDKGYDQTDAYGTMHTARGYELRGAASAEPAGETRCTPHAGMS